MKNGRRNFLGEEKMVVLRRHLVDKVAVSDVCDEAGIHPTLFYRWQKELFEYGAAAFGRGGDVGDGLGNARGLVRVHVGMGRLERRRLSTRAICLGCSH